ncbi:spherulin 4-like cell surface [Moniliophthora roreri MCA 2997]|uniref:Spherulin 4-like cell surface n=2 Tax=Moniliophthora roreri TaxID=221103 RepID=V2X7T4_MONRO|nr:spherulin 4-like cell surface [Moniliophthora roreri MCA 2997]KAI3616094.1 spherulin 4-like cell surface [Moniliophthora roreri]
MFGSSLSLKLLSFFAAATAAAAQLQSGILFPLYIYPFETTPCGGWTRVINVASAHPNLPFYLVVNPDSGPGLPQTQPNFDYTGCIPQLRNASPNVHIIGYVHTNYGSQPVQAVNTNVTTYAGWSAAYRPDGIFFDEAASNAGNVSYFSTLASQARATFGSSSPVILNPGTTANADYYPFSTLVITAENFYANFSPSQLSFSSSTPASKQAVVLHHGPSTTSASLVNQLISTDKIGAIFLTDAEYTSTPADWENFVSLVEVAASA